MAACASPAPLTTLSPTAAPCPVSSTRLPTPVPATLAPTIAPTAEPEAAPTDRALAPADVDVGTYKTKLLTLINDLRAANSCQPLQFEEQLQQAAQSHAEDMRDHGRLDHTGSDGTTLSDRLDRVGYPYMRAGENITNWFRTPQDVMVQWTEGPEIPDGPHRKNILNCAYTEVGIGLASLDDGVPYWVLDLANRKQ